VQGREKDTANVKLSVYARRSLTHQPTADAALLLEGSWPESEDALTADRWSLDDALDGRFAWIDQTAARLAARLGADADRPASPWDAPEQISPCYLLALELRYYLVKLLRPMAFFRDLRPLRPGDELRFFGAAQRDRDYADLLRQMARIGGATFIEHCAAESSAPQPAALPNGRLRRWLGAVLPRVTLPRWTRRTSPRVILAGNPRLLDPVCRELVGRQARVWWLYDRFAWGAWRRWHRQGVGQLVCNASLGGENRLEAALPSGLVLDGIDLAPALQRWWEARRSQQGPRLTRLVEQIDRHFAATRPDALLLDEDATPLSRAAVALARRRGIPSAVLQHGAPFCRFGFAPLAADRALLWGAAAQRQFVRWGVPADQLCITGSPWHDELSAALQTAARRSRPPAAARSKHVLLVLTSPPRDARPDAVALHLTGRTYEDMLALAWAAVAQRGDVQRLTIKTHPRAVSDAALERVRARYPHLPVQVIGQGDLADLLAGADCVISCGSSAGIDATLAGLPVIEIIPPGASDFLSQERWGRLGIARSAAEVVDLLARALNEDPAESAPHPLPLSRKGRGEDDGSQRAHLADVFDVGPRSAAARVVDELLAPTAIDALLPCPTPA